LIPRRFHGVVSELAKFGAVGLVNTVLDYAVLNLLLSIGPLKAKVASTIVATTASYVMNRQWTFKTRDRAGLRREYVLFFALNLVGLAIQLSVLAVAKYGLGFTEHGGGDDRLALNLFNALGIAVAMVFRFWAYRAFVFKTTEAVVTAGTVPAEAELSEAALYEAELYEAELAGAELSEAQLADVDEQLSELDVEIAAVEVALTDVAVAPVPRHSDEVEVSRR
jgi:putative flippase GtrA